MAQGSLRRYVGNEGKRRGANTSGKGWYASELPESVKAGAFARIQAAEGQGVDGPGRKIPDGRSRGEILRDGSGKGRNTPGSSAREWN